MAPVLDLEKVEYIIELTKKFDAEGGTYVRPRTREDFAMRMAEQSFLPINRTLKTIYLEMVASTKLARRAAVKADRKKRHKMAIHRRTTRQNIGVTAGKQPRSNHKPLGHQAAA